MLKELQSLRITALLIQIFLVFVAAVLSWNLLQGVREKYLFEWAALWILSTAAVVLILITRSIAIYRTNNEPQRAKCLDHEYQLKDRISTYVELRHSDHPFLHAIEADANRNISNVSAVRAAHIERGTIAPLAFCILLGLLLIALPYLPVPRAIAQKKAELSQIKTQANLLENQIRRLQKENPRLPELQKALNDFNKFSKDLQKSTLDRSEAFKKLNAERERLKELEKELRHSQENALASKLQSALDMHQKSTDAGQAGKQELEQLEKELKDSLENGQPLNEKLVKDAIQKGQFSKEQMQKMKKALEDFQRDRAESKRMLAEMQKALQNTQKGVASDKPNVTFDSKLKDRDLEKSEGGVEDGPGTTNQDIGPHVFDTKKKKQGEYTQDRTKAGYENIYKGERQEAGKDPLFLENQWNDSVDPKYTNIRTFGQNSDPNVTVSNPGDVTQNTAESEIRKEKVPASFQKIVKEYFESIQER